jgi:hypothetical protein
MIADGHLWDLIKIAQTLVASGWVSVVIRVTLNIEKLHVANNKVSVPRMMGLALFIAVIRQPFS